MACWRHDYNASWRWHLKRKCSIKHDTVYYLNQRPLNATVSTTRTCGSRNQGVEAGVVPFHIIPNNSLTEILLFVLPTVSCAGLDVLVFKREHFHQRTPAMVLMNWNLWGHYTDILNSYHWTNSSIAFGFQSDPHNASIWYSLSEISNLSSFLKTQLRSLCFH